jgi:hypothetical protein
MGTRSLTAVPRKQPRPRLTAERLPLAPEVLLQLSHERRSERHSAPLLVCPFGSASPYTGRSWRRMVSVPVSQSRSLT